MVRARGRVVEKARSSARFWPLALLFVCRVVLAEPAREPVLLITDPAALATIEEAAGHFGAAWFGSDLAHNGALAAQPAYRALIATIEADIAAIARRDPQAGVGIRGHAHRLFDVRWLRAKSARFALVGVAARLDRRSFAQEACGEVRLVYRLVYDDPASGSTAPSRLPMTMVAELGARDVRDPDCAASARRWLAPPGLSGRALGAWAVGPDGPLSAKEVSRARLVQLAVNLQAVRWPSAVRPDLGGHADYLMRAFSFDATSDRFRVRRLENTPDVARLAGDPALRARLLAYLRDPAQRDAIEAGTLRLPDEFLAESVVSVTPRGLARRKNRPFRQLFSPATLALPARAADRLVRSPEALVRRLDDLTCSGCHQSRSIAGFHLLGEDPADAIAGNALVTGSSPHTLSDLTRRASYLQALARGLTPDEAQPFAERTASGPGGYGAHCGLGDPGFSDWTCAAGLVCDPYEAPVGEETVGVCLPKSAQIGDPCEPARVQSHADAYRDRVARAPMRSCAGICERTSVGFPGGMCASGCEELAREAGCGGIAILTPFNLCLARGSPFKRCVTDHVRPAGLRACSKEAPCRDDYLCARGAGGEGTCIPPYFLLQLRVDGHPAPK